MNWTIILGKDAEKRLAKIPQSQRLLIFTAIMELKQGPYECRGDVKRLHGRSEWRLRVGGWRVLFLVENEIITITVVSVEPRGDAYRAF